MSRPLARALLAAAAIAFIPAAPAQQKASDIPVDTFFKRPEYQSMGISPDGNRLAALTPARGRDNLVVVDLVKRTKTIITSFDNWDVVQFFWVSNDRLFFRVADSRDALERIQYAGTFAIDVDGENMRDLSRLVFGRTPTALDRLPTIVPLARIPGERDEMIVAMAERRKEASDVYRLNTKSGRFTMLTSDAPADTFAWGLDWDRVPRIARAIDYSGPTVSIWYRDDDRSPWAKIHEQPAVMEDVDSLDPIRFAEDNKTLYVSSNIGRDRKAIFKYDPKARKLGEVVFEHPLIDLQGGLVFDRESRKLLGIHYNADKPGSTWIDPALDKLQRQLDASLPGKINRIFRGEENTSRLLVFSTSDTDPGKYYLLNREPLGMEELVATRPWLKPELMPERRFIRYKARDGLEIPAWVTIPKGSSGKNLPLVVNIHGGPWARTFGWTPWNSFYIEAPFFASRGYAVLEAEPRASAGFGRKHLSAGYRQFGQAMQDDITDGVLHLVKEGIVDKSKVCLYGGSYGGYATLQGLVKEPDLFRCGIPWIAVTDLVLWQTATWTDFAQARRMNWQPSFDRMLGSAGKDKAMLEAHSPYLHAKRIKAPVLLVMGEDDRRVPIDHGTRMREALQEAGVKHEYVIYPGEGHGFTKHANIVDFFTRVEKFLAENLK